jgi:ERCC4-type nuclease
VTTPLRIICDSREQAPWSFENYPVEIVRAGLKSGDYSLVGHEDRIALERKSLPDLVGSLSTGRARFEREMERLSALEFAAVLVEAGPQDIIQHNYRSAMNPASVMQSMFAWTVRYRVPFLLCGTRRHAEYTAHGLLSKFLREIEARQAEAQAVTELEGVGMRKAAKRKAARRPASA